MVAWIGDTFTDRGSEIANLFDLIAYTDTGLVEAHARSGFRSASAFVPLGTSRAAAAENARTARIPALAFVAVPTPNRREFLADVADPVAVFGPGWQHATELTRHKRDARRIAAPELATIYASHIGVLNIRHGTNVIHGLNHRHFAPYMQGTAVVTDAQPDIPHCFEAGKEILIYHDADELNCLYTALRRDPAKAVAIGMAGRRRVLACHTYAHRLATMAALVGVKPV
jgi:spore maturation protein CgeB